MAVSDRTMKFVVIGVLAVGMAIVCATIILTVVLLSGLPAAKTGQVVSRRDEPDVDGGSNSMPPGPVTYATSVTVFLWAMWLYYISLYL